MTREEAYKFLELYRKFIETGVKIVDLSEDKVELQYPNGNRYWFTDWRAAKSIEANS